MNFLDHNKRIVELCGGTYGESQSCKLFYPFEHIPTIVEKTLCQICFDISATYSDVNTTFLNIDIYFFIICHEDIAVMKTEPGLRYDLIAQEITKAFSYNDGLGIGRAKLSYRRPYQDVTSPLILGTSLQFSLFDISPEVYEKHAESYIR